MIVVNLTKVVELREHQKTIFVTWVLLFCFLAGQLMAFSHQHKGSSRSYTYKNSGVTIVKEKCNVCDMMHHTHMMIHQITLQPVFYVLSATLYNRVHNYKGISLILSAGRSPPVSLS
jgi:hypothetical protein